MNTNKHSVNYLNISILFLYLFLAIYISPSSTIEPYFLSEEGTIYFKNSYESSYIKALLSPYLGYYSLYANLVMSTAVHFFPIQYAPLITNISGFLFLFVIGFFIIHTTSPFHNLYQRTIALIFIIIIPIGFAKVQVHFAHFYFGILAVIILLSQHGLGWMKHAQRIALLFSGLTGTIAVFTSPLFLLKYYFSREKEDLVRVLVIALTSTIQFYIFLSDSSIGYPESYSKSRFIGFEIDVFLFTFFNKIFILNFLGFDAMNYFGEYIKVIILHKDIRYYCILFLILIGLIYILISNIKYSILENTSLLLLSIFLIFMLSFISSTGGENNPESKIYLLTGHHRYSYVPSVLLGFYFLIALNSSKTKFKFYIMNSLVVLMLIISFMGYFHVWKNQHIALLSTGSNWKTEIQNWKNNPSYRIQVRPKGWSFQLSNSSKEIR